MSPDYLYSSLLTHIGPFFNTNLGWDLDQWQNDNRSKYSPKREFLIIVSLYMNHLARTPIASNNGLLKVWFWAWGDLYDRSGSFYPGNFSATHFFPTIFFRDIFPLHFFYLRNFFPWQFLPLIFFPELFLSIKIFAPQQKYIGCQILIGGQTSQVKRCQGKKLHR